jgi:hypothetical protein
MNPEAALPGSKGRKGPAGIPLWRTGKPDAILAAAVEVAHGAVLGIATAEQIGAHVGVRSEGERVVTHLFECRMPGYVGWQWFAVLARVSRSKAATVDEVGLLPSEDSLLAPEWLPWADRVRPGDDDAAQAVAAQADGTVPGNEAGEEDFSDGGDTADDDGVAEDFAADSDAADSDAT